jgi:hypothetical protein
MRVLIAGWFSFDDMGATAGDIIARDIICQWLSEAGVKWEVADCSKFPFKGGVNWRQVNSNDYTDLVFVCGPFGNGWPVTDLLNHFPNCRLIGLNLSLMESLDVWNPFSFLIERDSSRQNNPDVTFFGKPSAVPLVGIILSHKQKEYGSRALHEKANAAIEKLLENLEVTRVPIDTSLLNNKGFLRTSGEVEALMARMDIIITTRLHGTVLALKNGVPVIPIDPIAGGAKITRQVRTVEWPILFNAEFLESKALTNAFEYCLTETARLQAKQCAQKAIEKVELVHQNFLEQINSFSKG